VPGRGGIPHGIRPTSFNGRVVISGSWQGNGFLDVQRFQSDDPDEPAFKAP
jgi:hypothetical protein